MSDCISREALIDRLSKNLSACNHGTFSEMCYSDAIETVKHFPAADVEPVRHGRWEHKKNDYSVAWCSKCKGMFDTTWHGKTAKEYFAQFGEAYRYCPRCGAKMQGAENE